MGSEHTPGPWEHNGNAVHKRITASYATCICICEGEARRSNAQLIAALPDLLEALEEVIEDGLATNMESWRTKAKAAIAKAKGVRSA